MLSFKLSITKLVPTHDTLVKEIDISLNCSFLLQWVDRQTLTIHTLQLLNWMCTCVSLTSQWVQRLGGVNFYYERTATKTRSSCCHIASKDKSFSLISRFWEIFQYVRHNHKHGKSYSNKSFQKLSTSYNNYTLYNTRKIPTHNRSILRWTVKWMMHT